MKFQLWYDITEGIKLAKKFGLCLKNVDPTIINIEFGLKNQALIEKKKEMNDTCTEIELLHIQLSAEKDEVTASR